MKIMCDICGKEAKPEQGLYGCPGDGGKLGAKRGDLRHYNCHVEKYGKIGSLNAALSMFSKQADRFVGEVDSKADVKKPNVKKGDYNRSENARREFKTLRRRSEMGKSRVLIECPFCLTQFWAYVWSISGGGKKCPNCGSIHTSFGVAYPIEGNESL